VRASSILRKLLTPCLSFLHAARFKVLLAVTDAVFRSSHLTLTRLGRALEGRAQPKHRIKRVDRFLGNTKLHGDLGRLWQHLAHMLVKSVPRPVLIVDWTQLVGDEHALWVGISYVGRTIPLYAEAHTLKKGMKRSTHARFLRRLRELLPQDCKPVLIIDAEFCRPFFEACDAARFDFVVRLRGKCSLRPAKGDPTLARVLARSATRAARCVGKRMTYDTNRRGPTLRVVLGPRLRKSRKVRPGDSAYQKRALETWVLATTLETESPSRIVSLYSKRMQIEEMFRDVKDSRYGWAFDQTGTHDCERLQVLILAATLAMIVALLLGSALEQTQIARSLQANTERKRRVLSRFRIGAEVLAGTVGKCWVALSRITTALADMRRLQASLLAAESGTVACRECRNSEWHE
jgi:hypothetical protein